MDPGNIPFNTLIVGPTNSGKTWFLVDKLCGPFRGRFYFVVLICPTFAHRKTLYRFAERDPRLFVIICQQHEVELWLKVASFVFEGANTLIVLDDCVASKDVKGRTGELVKLGFSAPHANISVWVLTQQLSSIAKPFRENVAAIVLFYTPSAKSTKAIFEEYAGELSQDDLKQLIARLKERKFSNLVFSLRTLTRSNFRIKKTARRRKIDADEAKAFQEVMQMMETEPSGSPGGGSGNALAQPDMREQLAILVSTGKAKEAVGVHLTHEQVKRFTDKEVEKHYKRYETYMGAKTTETLIESFLMLATKAVDMVVRVKDADALQNELKNDYIITKELSALAGGLALRCGRLLAVAN